MSKTLTSFFRREVEKYQGNTPPHLKSVTDLTKYGTPNLDAASKGYFRRHGKQRILAKKGAKRNMPSDHTDGLLPFPKRAKGAYIYFGA